MNFLHESPIPVPGKELAFHPPGPTALELGHHDSCITFANYRELVRPKEAIRYWKIKPVKTTKVVPMVAR